MSQNQFPNGETTQFSETAWKCRPQTLDVAIYNSIVRFNEYRLPDALSPEDIVIDVGTHIGSFSQAVVMRGCRHVISIEPDCENFEIACENLKPYLVKGFVRPIRAAAWRSDANDDQLYFDGYHPFPDSYPGMQVIVNTGSGSVVWGIGTERVPKVALDDVIHQATNGGSKRIRILKLDCEGAEWPILLTSRRLHLIDQICGEFHEFGGEIIEISERVDNQPPLFQIEGFDRFTIDELVRVLGDSGFDVDYIRHRRPNGQMEGMGLFSAKRQSNN